MYTVGDLLKNARVEKNLTLLQVEKETRIRLKYLTSIEQNNWKVFPSKVYITGLIRSYAKFLGIDPAKAIAYFRRDYEKKDEVKFRKYIPSLHLLPETKKIVIGIFVVILLSFTGYFAYQLSLYLAPPSVSIISPKETVFRNKTMITIIGQTDEKAVVKIFNESYFPDNQGKFRYDFPIKKGSNRITIEVTGANGKKSILTEEFILE